MTEEQQKALDALSGPIEVMHSLQRLGAVQGFVGRKAYQIPRKPRAVPDITWRKVPAWRRRVFVTVGRKSWRVKGDSAARASHVWAVKLYTARVYSERTMDRRDGLTLRPAGVVAGLSEPWRSNKQHDRPAGLIEQAQAYAAEHGYTYLESIKFGQQTKL